MEFTDNEVTFLKLKPTEVAKLFLMMNPVIIITQLTANSFTQSCFPQADDCRRLVFIEKYTLVSAEKYTLSHVKGGYLHTFWQHDLC